MIGKSTQGPASKQDQEVEVMQENGGRGMVVSIRGSVARCLSYLSFQEEGIYWIYFAGDGRGELNLIWP